MGVAQYLEENKFLPVDVYVHLHVLILRAIELPQWFCDLLCVAANLTEKTYCIHLYPTTRTYADRKPPGRCVLLFINAATFGNASAFLTPSTPHMETINVWSPGKFGCLFGPWKRNSEGCTHRPSGILNRSSLGR